MVQPRIDQVVAKRAISDVANAECWPLPDQHGQPYVRYLWGLSNTARLQASTLVARLMFDLLLLAETEWPFGARRCSPQKSAGHAPACLLMLLVQGFFEVDAEGCFHGGRGKKVGSVQLSCDRGELGQFPDL